MGPGSGSGPSDHLAPRPERSTARLGLVPSGKEPHFDASVGEIYETLFGDVQAAVASAAELADRFMAASYTVEANPSYEQDPS